MRTLTLNELQQINGGSYSSVGTVVGMAAGGGIGFFGAVAIAVSTISAGGAISAMAFGAPAAIAAGAFGVLIGGFIGNACGKVMDKATA